LVTPAPTEVPTVTFVEYAEEWLQGRPDLAVRTVELYRWLLRRHITPTFGDVPLDGITSAAVRLWHAGIAREHPTTAAKAYRLVSSIMRTALVDELIAKSPCQVRGAAVEKAPERPIATMAEVEQLAAAMPTRLRIAVQLAAWCQLRRSEVRGLRRKDIDLTAGTLSVTETRTTTMAGSTVVKAPKTRAGRRTVAIPAPTLDALVAHLEAFTGPDPDDLMADVTDRVLGLAWTRARLAAGRWPAGPPFSRLCRRPRYADLGKNSLVCRCGRSQDVGIITAPPRRRGECRGAGSVPVWRRAAWTGR
jgi:integrase